MNIHLLHKLIVKLYKSLQKDKRSKYKRDLPFGDYFVDRWDRAKSMGFDEGTSVYDNCLVLGDVTVGKNCWIGPFTILDGSGGGLVIGDHCDISAGVHLYTHDTVERVVNGAPIQFAPTKIGSHTYIGPNCIIAKGVTVGDYVIVGANSFVNTDIPSFSKGWGVPFKIKGKSSDSVFPT